MLRRVKRYIYKRIMCLLNPVKYYRKIGVKNRARNENI